MRTNNSIKNSITQFMNNIIEFSIIFLNRTLFIRILGVEYNGLNGLFTNVLTILNLFELGIGSSITYNLYKYVKSKDNEKIKSIMQFYKKAYNYIALVILLTGLIITPFIKYIVKDVTVDVNIYIIFLLFLLSTVATYILSYKRNLIIANQKNYIVNIIQIIYVVILNIVQIVILFVTKNFYLYLSIKILCILIENFVIDIKANKMYPYLKEKSINTLDNDVKDNIISRVKALVIHKTSGAVTHGTDNILISAFLGITTTGLYTSYNYIISSIEKIFGGVISTTTPSIGNLLIENNKDKNYIIFKRIRFLNLWITIFTSSCILLITQPFIRIWIGKKFLLSSSVLIVLVINYFQTMMRKTYISFKDAAGIWIEDKVVPIIQLSVNLVSSIFLLHIIGLSGVFIGTILSSLVLWCYSYPKYVYINLFNKKLINYVKDVIVYIIIFILVMLMLLLLSKISSNIIISLLISIFVPNIVLYIIFRKTDEFNYYKKLILKKIRK